MLNVQLQSGRASDVRIKLLDITGRAVVSKTVDTRGAAVQTISLDVSALPGGVYQLQVANNGVLETEKVVITK